jgi:hypothetical protein
VGSAERGFPLRGSFNGGNGEIGFELMNFRIIIHVDVV